MIGYATTDVFSAEQLSLFRCATLLVGRLGAEPELRCHELTEAVAYYLGLRRVDGKYGSVEHSWIVLGPPPVILDVYAVGRFPRCRSSTRSTGA